MRRLLLIAALATATGACALLPKPASILEGSRQELSRPASYILDVEEIIAMGQGEYGNLKLLMQKLIERSQRAPREFATRYAALLDLSLKHNKPWMTARDEDHNNHYFFTVRPTTHLYDRSDRACRKFEVVLQVEESVTEGYAEACWKTGSGWIVEEMIIETELFEKPAPSAGLFLL